MNEIDKLFKWCQTNNLSIESSSEDSINIEEKKIFLGKHRTEEIKLFSLLHECGHFIIQNKKNYKKKYPYSSIFDGVKQNWQKPKFHLEDVLYEEMSAWREGLKLTEKLKIKIDRIKYRKYATRYILGYMKNMV